MTSSVGDTPLTFRAAFAEDNVTTTPPVVEPSTSESTTDQPPASATISPVPPEPLEVGSDLQGSIPTARHKEILEGERASWATERQRFAWADDLTKTGATADQVREAWAIRQALQQDPSAVLGRLFEQAKTNPAIAQMVRQWMPADAPPPQPEAKEPQPDFTTPDGVPFYSAAQLKEWMKWNHGQTRAEYQPLLDERQQQIERDKTKAAFDADVKQRLGFLKLQLGELEKNALFNEHRAEVDAYVAERKYQITPNDAWVHILHTKVLPTLSQTERAKTVAELQTQAHASSLKPSTGATETRPVTKFSELPKEAW